MTAGSEITYALASAKERYVDFLRKHFFFEKKKQKTFIF